VARATSGESDSKRAKLTPPNAPSTINSHARDGSYTSLEALQEDLDYATAEVLNSTETKVASPAQPSSTNSALRVKALAFQERGADLIKREKARIAHVTKPVASTETGEAAEDTVEIKSEEMPEGRTVLTLYGHASGPKQLFSSLQQPTRVSPSDASAIPDFDTSVKITLPLRETGLPNIISTTEVYPLPTDAQDGKKKTKTFEEVFPAPAHLPQLSPPKIAKPMTTKNSTISFVPQDSLPRPSRKSSTYANQNLATGSWLGYGGVDMPKDPTSPTAKQKSRQRALSTGEAQLPPSEATLAAVQQAKEDALFRSAYSSFAPSRDDATAIVPEETKNKIWWQKIGEKRFNDTFPVDPALLGFEDGPVAEVNGEGEDPNDFKDAVENFTALEEDPFESSKNSELEKGTEEVLLEISELLETLASHQRIRNSSLATNPRTPVIQNSSLASLAGSPSTPSTEEIDVYQILKSQLTLLIAQLPPYAVAKLNGDQLEELNISRTMIIETEDHNGVLEEDPLSKRSAAPAAAGPPTLSRMASAGTTHSHYPPSTSQFGRSTPSAHASSVRPVQASQGYYPQQQSVHRSPSIHYQRSSSGTGQSYQAPAATYGSSTPRQSYSTSQYPQQTPRASYGQATTGQYYSQRPAPVSKYGGVVNPQYYQSTPQTQGHRYQAPQASNGYYPRPANVPAYNGYNAVQSPHARTASPLKANPSAHSASYPSSRPAYGTPVSGSQTRSGFYPQGVPATSQYATPQPSTPSTIPPTGYASMGTNQTQMMLDRQQVQQSQARLAAQNSFHRMGSDTPQPAGSQQPNGTPTMMT
jgi:hypothetical protein